MTFFKQGLALTLLATVLMSLSAPVARAQETYPIWRAPLDLLAVIWGGAGWFIQNMATKEEEPVSRASAEAFNACVERAMNYCTELENAGKITNGDDCLWPRIQICYDKLEAANR